MAPEDDSASATKRSTCSCSLSAAEARHGGWELSRGVMRGRLWRTLRAVGALRELESSGEDALVDLLQFRRRANAEALTQQVTGHVVDRQGLGLPPSTVERSHEEAASELSNRVLDKQGGRFGGGFDVAPSLHFAGELLLRAREAQLAEDAALLARERPRDPGEGFAGAAGLPRPCCRLSNLFRSRASGWWYSR